MLLYIKICYIDDLISNDYYTISELKRKIDYVINSLSDKPSNINV